MGPVIYDGKLSWIITDDQLHNALLTAYGKGLDFALTRIGNTKPETVIEVLETIKKSLQ